ncbi:MAG TPA: histidine phosphatase family protein [Chloroflexota bacterium]
MSGEHIRPLVLIRHALPAIDPRLPARAWPLSDEGREAARALAERVRPLGVTRVVSSVEPKAWETGAIVAQRLGVPCSAAAGLHEHDREGAPFLPADELERALGELFARPDELVYGRETANQARDRFATAVGAVLTAYPDDRVAISSHGTVISLLVAQRRGVDAHAFQQGLAMPDLVVINP